MIKLLDLWAPWCVPCKMMEPIIKELEEELKGRVDVVKINVDENNEEASKYGVMSIPTYIVIKDNKEVGRKVGMISKEELVKLLNV